MLTDVRSRPLSWRGTLVYTGFGILLLGLQSTVGTRGGPWSWSPDLCFLLVLYWGLNVSEAPGAALSVFLGLARDVTGEGVFGFYAGVFFLIFLLVHQLRRKIDPAALYYRVLFV
ncbi:MAG: rod shape-determining protein MreD, partial [Thermodesulfobacteriota bacterium]